MPALHVCFRDETGGECVAREAADGIGESIAHHPTQEEQPKRDPPPQAVTPIGTRGALESGPKRTERTANAKKAAAERRKCSREVVSRKEAARSTIACEENDPRSQKAAMRRQGWQEMCGRGDPIRAGIGSCRDPRIVLGGGQAWGIHSREPMSIESRLHVDANT